MSVKILTALALAACLRAQTLPNAVPMPTPEIQYLSSTGAPLVGAKLCTYAAGTSTPLATYTDSSAGTPNNNPITLDANGRASVWVGPALYKFVLRVGGSAYPASDACTTGAVQWSQDQVGDTTLYFVNYVKSIGTCTSITFIATGTGAVSRTCTSKLGDVISVKDFGAVGNGTTDDYAAILAAHTRAVSIGACLFFPAATYLHKTVFAISDQGTCWIGEPGTRIKYGGLAATPQFTFDGSVSGNGSGTFRQLIFDGNGLIQDGLLLRALNHGEVSDVRVTNVSRNAVIDEGSTLTVFTNITVSGNVEAFSTQPVTGWVSRLITGGGILDGTGGGVVEVNNLKVEKVSGPGITLAGHQGMHFNGGTSEGNGGIGLTVASTAPLLSALNMDIEANTGGDLDDSAAEGVFVNCIFYSAVASGVHLEATASTTSFYGGMMQDATIESGASFISFIGVNFIGSGTQITNNSSSTSFLASVNGYAGSPIASTFGGPVNFPYAVTFPGTVTGNPNFTGNPLVGAAANDDGISKFQVYQAGSGPAAAFGIPAAANDAYRTAHFWSAGSDAAFGLTLQLYPSATQANRKGAITLGDEAGYRTINFQGAGGRVTFGGATDDGAVSVQTSGGYRDTGVLAASLASHADTNGTIRYCSDCTVSSPSTCTLSAISNCVCGGGGNGAFAKRLNGAWYCGLL